MKKARNKHELHVLEAGHLYDGFEKKQLSGFCLPVSLRALGGNVHLYRVLKSQDRMARLSTVDDYGLKTGFFLDIFEPTDTEFLTDIFDELITARIDETYQEFTGILIHISFSEENHPNNHYIALIPRILLSHKVSRRLSKTNSHIFIDTSSKPIIGKVKMTDLVEYLNAMITMGAGIGFMQIFKEIR